MSSCSSAGRPPRSPSRPRHPAPRARWSPPSIPASRPSPRSPPSPPPSPARRRASDTAVLIAAGTAGGSQTPPGHARVMRGGPRKADVMIARLVAFALHQRFVTLALALLLTAGGIVSFHRLPIEAYPDVADVEVDVITLWPGHAAEEVERYITIQLEKELNGIAKVTFLRSFSNFGLSNIRILFADGTDNYWSRQQVLERITQADIPTDAKPQLGPLASPIGEVYRYTLESKTMPLVDLKAYQDWVLEREVRKVP